MQDSERGQALWGHGMSCFSGFLVNKSLQGLSSKEKSRLGVEGRCASGATLGVHQIPVHVPLSGTQKEFLPGSPAVKLEPCDYVQPKGCKWEPGERVGLWVFSSIAKSMAKAARWKQPES